MNSSEPSPKKRPTQEEFWREAREENARKSQSATATPASPASAKPKGLHIFRPGEDPFGQKMVDSLNEGVLAEQAEQAKAKAKPNG